MHTAKLGIVDLPSKPFNAFRSHKAEPLCSGIGSPTQETLLTFTPGTAWTSSAL